MRSAQHLRSFIVGLGFVCTLIGCAYVLGTRFVVQSDLWAFLPTVGDSAEQKFTRDVLAGELSRSLILAVAPSDTACIERANCPNESLVQARQVAARLAQALTGHSALAEVSGGPAPGFEGAVHDLYFPRRFALAPPSSEPTYSAPYIQERVQQLKAFLMSPKSALYRSQLVLDPLLFFPTQIERLARLKPAGVEVIDGQFVTSSGMALVFCSLGPHLNGTQKAELHASIQAAFQRANQGVAPARLLLSGTLPFEVYGEAKSKLDMERVGTISTVMAVGLALWLFRSLSSLFAVLLPVVLAYVVGCVSTLLVFGQVHVLTLAFGASLVGVSIDYPSHLLNEAALRQSSLKEAAVHARPGLLLGCLATVVGFFAFGLTSATAMLEVGVFAVTGLLAALVATLYVLPELPVAYGPGNLQRKLAEQLVQVLPALTRHARSITLILALALAVSSAFIFLSHDKVDAQALDPSPTHLKQDDLFVRSQLGLSEDMLVVSAPDVESALTQSARLAQSLMQLERQGKIAGYRSVAALYVPQAEQIDNRSRAASPKTAQDLRIALLAADFDADAFSATPLGKSELLSSPLLGLDELLDSPLRGLVRPFLLKSERGTSVITQVTATPAQLAPLIEQHPSVVHYQPELFLAKSFSQLTHDIKLALVAAVGLVLLLVVLRHRRLRPTLAAFLPAALGAFLTLLLVRLAQPLHMFHYLSAISVLSMGVDYGTFMVETHRREGRPDAWPSVLSAALSTLISFGCLGLSEVPALRAIGVVIGLGTLISIVTTPLCYAVVAAPSLFARKGNP